MMRTIFCMLLCCALRTSALVIGHMYLPMVPVPVVRNGPSNGNGAAQLPVLSNGRVLTRQQKIERRLDTLLRRAVSQGFTSADQEQREITAETIYWQKKWNVMTGNQGGYQPDDIGGHWQHRMSEGYGMARFHAGPYVQNLDPPLTVDELLDSYWEDMHLGETRQALFHLPLPVHLQR